MTDDDGSSGPRAGLGRGGLYFDDLAVGQRFTTGSHTVTAEEIKAFAAQFDPQPFHLDEAAACDSLFGGLAASGWHTAALSMRLLVDGGLALSVGSVGMGVKIDWLQPVRPGDRLHVEGEVIELMPSRTRPGRGRVSTRNETRNQHGRVVQLAITQILVPRRPA
jgi:acyl dehydratase